MTRLYSNGSESNATLEDQAAGETAMPMSTALTLLKFGLPVVILLGTVGNVLSFAVLLRRSMRSTPMYFYLMLLAVVDTMVLYTSAFKTWIRVLTGFEALHVSDFGCKLITFLLLNSLYLSAWLIVLVTLDRFLVVWFPFRGYLMMRIRQARVFAALLAVVVSFYNAHVFWTFGLHRDDAEGPPKCQSIDKSFFSEHVFEYLKLVSYCAVPFAVVAALNVGIIVRISQAFSRTSSAGVVKRPGCQSPKNCADSTSSLPKQTFSAPHNPDACDNVSCQHSQRQRTRNHSYSAQFHRGPLSQRRSMFPDHLATSENPMPSLTASGTATITSTNAVPATTSTFMEDAQRQQQRRLTRMLLFISFTWLALTAPFTLHSFIPEKSSDTASSYDVSKNVTNDLNVSSFFQPSLDEAEKNHISGSTKLHRFRQPFLIDARTSSFVLPTHSSPEIVNTVRTSLSVGHRQTTSLPFLLVHISNHDGEDATQTTTDRVIESAHRATNNRTITNPSMTFLVKTVCFLLVYVNHASNFYLYCISGRRFRYELRAMFRSARRHFRQLFRRRGGINYAASNSNSVMMVKIPVREVAVGHAADVQDMTPGDRDFNHDDTNGSCSGGGALKVSQGDSSSSRSKTTGMHSMGSKKVSKLDLATLYN